MFFSTYVLTKKGPLAKIWLAAHWDKKLTKGEVKVVDLNQTVLHIVQPAVPIALRTSGELMLGIVRIYALKVRHLQKDAADATLSLLRPKGVSVLKDLAAKDVGAVTFEVVVGRAEAAQACEADFADIADIIFPGSKKTKDVDFHETVGATWFATESSQFQEDLARNLSQDEISRMRNDLLNFAGDEGRRAESATSSSSKKTGSSVEKGRASSGAGVQGVEGLDIGLPAPDELDFAAQPVAQEAQLDDPFGLPPLRPSAQGDALAAPLPPARKAKPVNVLDLNAIAMSKETLQKNITDRRDIVNQERRHGPVDMDEADDRAFIRSAETTTEATTCQLLTHIRNPMLRGIYEEMLRASVSHILEETERARASGRTSARASGREAPEVALPGELPAPDAAPDLPPFEFTDAPPLPAEPEEDAASPGQKRKRGAKEGAFSASTLATLEKLRGIFESRKQVSFSTLATHQKRVDVARMFVDVLALASHGNVEVRQSTAFGDISITPTARLSSAAN